MPIINHLICFGNPFFSSLVHNMEGWQPHIIRSALGSGLVLIFSCFSGPSLPEEFQNLRRNNVSPKKSSKNHQQSQVSNNSHVFFSWIPCQKKRCGHTIKIDVRRGNPGWVFRIHIYVILCNSLVILWIPRVFPAFFQDFSIPNSMMFFHTLGHHGGITLFGAPPSRSRWRQRCGRSWRKASIVD